MEVYGIQCKMLEKINEDLKRTVIVDNIKESFYLNQENGIEIKSWYGDKDDKELIKLGKVLDALAEMADVRVGIKELVPTIM